MAKEENPYEYGDVRPDADANAAADNPVSPPPPAEEESSKASADVEAVSKEKEEEPEEELDDVGKLVKAAQAVYDRFPNAHSEMHMKELRDALEKFQ